jgi:hypothetical protein
MLLHERDLSFLFQVVSLLDLLNKISGYIAYLINRTQQIKAFLQYLPAITE